MNTTTINYKKPKITTEDVQNAQRAEMNFTSPIEQIESPGLQINTNTDAKYMRDLSFMEEKVTFVIGRSANKGDPDPIILGNNGEQKIVPRGNPVTLARKFLDSAISYTEGIDTQEVITNSGERVTRVFKVAVPTLQLSVLQDTQEGMNWFASKYNVQYS